MRTLEQVLATLPAKQRKAVDARAKELITAYSLREIRRAMAKTQKDVASATGLGQEHISRLEQRGDMMISSLSRYVGALGGNLRLVADLPGAKPVEISLEAPRKPRNPKQAAAKSRRKTASVTKKRAAG